MSILLFLCVVAYGCFIDTNLLQHIIINLDFQHYLTYYIITRTSYQYPYLLYIQLQYYIVLTVCLLVVTGSLSRHYKEKVLINRVVVFTDVYGFIWTFVLVYRN